MNSNLEKYLGRKTGIIQNITSKNSKNKIIIQTNDKNLETVLTDTEFQNLLTYYNAIPTDIIDTEIKLINVNNSWVIYYGQKNTLKEKCDNIGRYFGCQNIYLKSFNTILFELIIILSIIITIFTFFNYILPINSKIVLLLSIKSTILYYILERIHNVYINT